MILFISSATTLTFNLMRRNPSDNVSGLLVFTVDLDRQEGAFSFLAYFNGFDTQHG